MCSDYVQAALAGEADRPLDKTRCADSTFIGHGLLSAESGIVTRLLRTIVTKKKNECVLTQIQIVKTLEQTTKFSSMFSTMP